MTYQIPSKEEAFNPLPNERNVPINYSQHVFTFSRKWFRWRNQMTWSTFLLPHFSNAAPMRMIQIGVFEGMDLIWCLQHIAGHPDSRVLAIDPWIGEGKLDDEFMEGVYKRAQHNLSPWSHKVRLVRGESQKVLSGDVYAKDFFDLVIIDGDHHADPTYVDAVNSLKLLRSGGWMVFDDVRNRVHKKNHVQQGLERFLADYGEYVRPAWSHRHCEAFEKI